MGAMADEEGLRRPARQFPRRGDCPSTVEVVNAANRLVKVGVETLRDATRHMMGKDSDATVRQANQWSFKDRRPLDLYEELHAEP